MDNVPLADVLTDELLAAAEPAAERRTTVLAAESTSSEVLRRERGKELDDDNASLERLVQHLSAAQRG